MFALLPVEDECVFYFEGRAGVGARQPAAGWGVGVQPGVQPSAAAAGQGHSSPVLRPHERPAGEAASSHLGRPYWNKGPFQPEHLVWCSLQDLVSSHLLVAALPNRCCVYAHGIFSAFFMHFFFFNYCLYNKLCPSPSPMYGCLASC